MAIAKYVIALGERARMRQYHETRRRRVLAFLVQPEVELRGHWTPVIRCDTAHAQPHMDFYDTPTRKLKKLLDTPLENALTLADEDIRQNWERYQVEFLRRDAG